MAEEFIRQIEEYIFVEQDPKKADIIFVPGNGYPQMAEHAADLYHQGFAPYVLPSGRYSVTAGSFSGVLAKKEQYGGNYKTEWEFLREVLLCHGVPESAVLREDRATFTYENALFSKKVTDEKNINVKRAILCCRNYHARRALLYYQLVYPDAEILVCPSCTDGIDRENWKNSFEGIDAVMGEVTRIIKQFSVMMK